MTDLSPAAQAVLDAANASATNAWSDATHQRFRTGVAAALRAAADQLVPEPNDIDKKSLSLAAIRNHCKVRDKLLSIATELEGNIT